MGGPAAQRRDGTVHPDHLREVASHLLTGVTVITAAAPGGGEGAGEGCTANAVTSLSLDPPLMLICLKHESKTLAATLDAGHFAINLLGASGHDLCRRFAGKDEDLFAGVAHRHGVTGAPLLDGALGWIECELEQAIPAGDHTVCTGLVVDALAASDAPEPLAFFRGRLFGVQPPEA